MIQELNQIKRFLAEKFNLQIEGSDKAERNGWPRMSDIRVVGGEVPDGIYEIPIGDPPIAHKITLKDGNVSIGGRA